MNNAYIGMPVICYPAFRQLKPVDLLTYFALKSLEGDEQKVATPNIKANDVARIISAPVGVVISAMKKLKQSNLVTEYNDNYAINEPVKFAVFMLPVSILQTKLSYLEKAYLLFLRCYCLDNDVDIQISMNMFIENCKLEAREVFEMYASLQKKGYLRTVTEPSGKSYFQLSGPIKWRSEANDWFYESFKQCLANKAKADSTLTSRRVAA